MGKFRVEFWQCRGNGVEEPIEFWGNLERVNLQDVRAHLQTLIQKYPGIIVARDIEGKTIASAHMSQDLRAQLHCEQID